MVIVPWKALLIEAGRVYTDAKNARDNYSNETFIQQLEASFSNIHKDFTERKLEALLSSEDYKIEIGKVSSSIEGWLRERRQDFLKLKR